MPLIGIDLGTSFIKGAVLNLQSLRPEHVERVPFPEPIEGLQPVFREYDTRAVLDAVSAVLDRLLALAPECEGILWSTQMHGLVLTDAVGRARSNLLTWLDQRVTLPHPSGQGSYFDVLSGRLSATERQQLGGTELRPGLPVGSLFYMAENGQLPTGEAIPASLAGFVLARLCGDRPVTEVTNAQAHGALNLETMSWHHGVIDKLGLAQLNWPEIKPQNVVVHWLERGGRRIPLYAPVGDFQCAMVGSLLAEAELSLNISTGSQVSMLRSRVEFGPFQTRPFFDGRYLNTVTTIPAGRALSALVKLLCEMSVAQGVAVPDPWAYVAREAAAASEPALRANLAFFASAVGDHGELANLREEEMTVGHVFRAAFRNMADNYHACALLLDADASWRQLVFSGALPQKIATLREFISDRFQMPHRSCPHPEDAMLGLLTLGLAFTGRANSVGEATQIVRESFLN